MTDKTAPEQEAPLTDERAKFEAWAKHSGITAKHKLGMWNAWCAALASSPQPKGTQPGFAYLSRNDLRALVDHVWQTAYESGQVPSTADADKMIDHALGDDAIVPQPKGTRPPTEPAFRLKWKNGAYYVDQPFIGDVDCYTAEQMRAALSAPRPLVAEPPDMLAVCAALGFDPTNHHNAAKCPYCRPASLSPAPLITPEPLDWNDGLCQNCRMPVAPDASSTVAPVESRVESELHRQLQDDLDHPAGLAPAPSSGGGPSGLA